MKHRIDRLAGDGSGPWVRRLAIAGVLTLVFAQAAHAQSARYGAGWSAGGSLVTELNSDATGVQGDAELDPGYGFVVGIHVDRWFGSDHRFGMRYQGSYQQPQFDWTPGPRRINTFSADVSALVRLLLPRDGGAVFPYLAVGLGGIWYDLGTGPPTSFQPRDAFHDGTSQILPAGLVAIGADIPIPLVWDPYPVGIRVEVADHVSLHSPLRSVSEGSRHGPVHHLRFTVGLYSAFSY